RDEIAQRTDRAPGRVLPDAAIAELATREHPEPADVDRIAGFRRRTAVRHRSTWVEALERARGLTRRQLPPLHLPSDAPPPPRSWDRRDPAAAARWERVRPAVLALAESHELPVENLLTPALLRELAWRPPSPLDAAAVDGLLAEGGARPWQRELVVPVVTPLLDDALTDPEVLERPAEPGGRSRRRRD
uniref:HRDC domain-containing protein n=1 Tax=Desertihabitans aurantiacus TaxID=2282477 RepID=UPI0018E52C24